LSRTDGEAATPALNFRHLRYFHAIAHAGTLTGAARQLNVSQSALSTQLAELEASLGHALFAREGRRLVLTEAGRIALDYADTIVQAGDELVSTLAGRPRASRQVLRVGAVATLSRNFQLKFLEPLVRRPDTELIVRSGAARELLALLASHALDLVLAAGDIARSQPDMIDQLIEEQPVSLVGRPSPEPLRFPADLHGARLLLPGPDSGVRAAFDRLLERAGVVPAITAEVDDMAMLRLLAREADALTLVPPIVVRDELAAGVLVERHRLEGLTERFHALTLRRRFQHPLVTELLAPYAA